MHRLLERQLKRYIGPVEPIPEEWQCFVDAVDEAYRQADADRAMIERSLELASQELYQRNQQLRQQVTAEHTQATLMEEQGRALLDVVQTVAIGNLDVEVEVPEGVEVLSDLAVGIEIMIDDIRDMIASEAQARAEAEEARRQLETALEEVLSAQRRYVQHGWESYVAAEAVQGYLRSKDEEGPTAEAWLPTMTAAVRDAKLVTEDGGEEGMTLAVPIDLYGEVVGVLGFDREGGGAWSESDVEVVRAVVDQVAQALESQRLLDEQQRSRLLMDERVKALDCLNEIGRKTEETPPIPEFLQWVAERIPSAMRYVDVCLAVIELDGQAYGALEAIDLPSQIVMGLRVGGELRGKVCIAYTEEHGFVDEESALLGDIARRVSGYIENQQLLRETQARAERERLVRTITDRIRRGTDSEAILRVGVQELSRMLGTSDMVLRLGDAEQLLERARTAQKNVRNE